MTDQQMQEFFTKYFKPSIDGLRDELKGDINGLKGEVGSLKGEVLSLRAEMGVRFDAADEKMLAMEERIIKGVNQQTQTSVDIAEDHERRIKKLEKAQPARQFPFATAS
jgi:hypothetical protein